MTRTTWFKDLCLYAWDAEVVFVLTVFKDLAGERAVLVDETREIE